MAYNNNQNDRTANGGPKADAWLNITLCNKKGEPIVKKNGKDMTTDKGVPLYRNSRIGRALIEAMEADPEYSIKLIGKVAVRDEDEEDLDLTK